MADTAADKFATVVDSLIATTNGRVQRINATSMKTNGKMFGWLRGDRLSLRVPVPRAAVLVAMGEAEYQRLADGRMQTDWIVLKSDDVDEWLERATDAEAAIPPYR